MNARVRELFAARDSSDREAAYQAFNELMALADEPVSWGYEVWDRMVGDLSHKDGSKRSFAAQMLARLAVSDLAGRMLDDFAKVAAVMKDEKTVTARHALQSVWRIGLASPQYMALVLDALDARFRECRHEKNGALVRTDVITALGHLAAATQDDAIEPRAQALMDSETDQKARKKQQACWRKSAAPATPR